MVSDTGEPPHDSEGAQPRATVPDGENQPPITPVPEPNEITILITGETAVGKSTLMYRYKDGFYHPNIESTRLANKDVKPNVMLDPDNVVDIKFTDLEGQNRLMPNPINGQDVIEREIFFTSEHEGVVLMFSLAEYNSFVNAIKIDDQNTFKGFLGEILENFKVRFEACQEGDMSDFSLNQRPGEYNTFPPLVLLGNKNDLSLGEGFGTGRERVREQLERMRHFFSESEHEMIKTLPPIDYLETSAKRGTNVYPAMTLLLKKANMYKAWLDYYRDLRVVLDELEHEGVEGLDQQKLGTVLNKGRKVVRAREGYCDFLKEIEFVSTVFPNLVYDIQGKVRSIMGPACEAYDRLGNAEEKRGFAESTKQQVADCLRGAYADVASCLQTAPASLDQRRVLDSLPAYVESFAKRAITFMVDLDDRLYLAEHLYTADVLPDYLQERYLDMNSGYDIAGVVAVEGRCLAVVDKTVKIREEDPRLAHFKQVTENLRERIGNLESYCAPKSEP